MAWMRSRSSAARSKRSSAHHGRCRQACKRPLHLGGQVRFDLLEPPLQQGDRLGDGLLMLLLHLEAAAVAIALAHVEVEAGALLPNVPGKALPTGGQAQGGAQGVHDSLGGVAAGVRAEIACPVLRRPVGQGEAGVLLPGQADVGVALVVLEQDVVLRGVGFDLACFQHQRLELALADDDVERVGVGDHLADLVVVGHTLPEILADPDAEPLGLADIDDGIGFIPDNINTG